MSVQCGGMIISKNWGKPSRAPGVVAAPTTMHNLNCEIASARRKFPGNRHTLAALTEEVGELAKELLEGGRRERVRAEALQVACVAIRIYEEGDSAFGGSAPAETESA